jgi:hypothetical protein
MALMLWLDGMMMMMILLLQRLLLLQVACKSARCAGAATFAAKSCS